MFSSAIFEESTLDSWTAPHDPGKFPFPQGLQFGRQVVDKLPAHYYYHHHVVDQDSWIDSVKFILNAQCSSKQKCLRSTAHTLSFSHREYGYTHYTVLYRQTANRNPSDQQQTCCLCSNEFMMGFGIVFMTCAVVCIYVVVRYVHVVLDQLE